MLSAPTDVARTSPGRRDGLGVALTVLGLATAALASLAITGCKKAPPDFAELSKTLGAGDAQKALSEIAARTGQEYGLPSEFNVLDMGRSPATVVCPIETRRLTNAPSPIPGVPVYEITGRVYLVLQYKWTGRAWKRISAELKDQPPGPLPLGPGGAPPRSPAKGG